MPTKMLIKNLDEKYAEKMRNECMTGDKENNHIQADNVLCELLIELGCNKIVDVFNDVGKWYA